jgi:hypothetical protein
VDRKKVVPALRVGHNGRPRRLASSAGGRHRRACSAEWGARNSCRWGVDQILALAMKGEE